MPKGRVPRREAKKPKKQAKKDIVIAPISTSEGVEVMGKRRRRKQEADF